MKVKISQRASNWVEKIKIGLMILGLAAGAIASADSVFSGKKADNGKIKFVQDEIIVKFKGDDKPFRVIKVSEGGVLEEIKKYQKRADVIYAEPNYIVSIQAMPNDPGYSNLWGLNNTGQTGGTPDADIDAPEAWDTQTGNVDTVIAVIDTGVDYNHSDLAANIWINPGEIAGNGTDDDKNGFIDDVRGWDFYNNDNNPFDDNGHGTHCSGTIGAAGNNGIGVVGVSWNVKIMPLKFLSSGGSGTTTGAIGAINYATLMGVDIMSNSWGGGGYSQALKDAIQAANNQGILFVAAAGNEYSDNDAAPHYPSNYDTPNVVAVAATDHNDQKANFSNWGAESVDLGAPGVNIYSTVPSGSCELCDPAGYKYLNGTSMAAPHVAGAAGLIKAQFPELSSDGIKSRLLGGADTISSLSGITVTGGRLNAYNSLEADNIFPAAIDDLAAGDPAISSVILTWTATGDDGEIGAANSYDVRYSTLPITEENWNIAIQAMGEPKPKSAGSAETFEASGLDYNTTYYFALKAIDNAGNVSGLSNIVFETTKTPVIAFRDDMENGVNGWIHSGAGDNWQLGVPASGPGYAYSGSNVWATNLGGNYGADYMNAQLVSPSISLAEVQSAQFVFQHYYYTESYYDGGIVELSADNGITWTRITPLGGYPENALSPGNPLGAVPAYSGYSGAGWRKARFDISSYDGMSNIKIRFRFGTDSSINSYPGWYIDDVEILAESMESNNPPLADDQNATTDEDISLAVTLTAVDLDGDPLTYAIVSNPSNGTLSGSAPNVIYTPNANYFGSDSFTFRAYDGKAYSNIATVSVAINPVNDAPVADAGTDKSGYADDVITFSGSSSYDADGTIVSYNWDFGDESVGYGVNVSHTYSTAGNYTATLTVVDNDGATGTDTAAVIVAQKPVQVLCWSATNQYLYKASVQAGKFCKCAQGAYGYNSYKLSTGKKTAWKYSNTADNAIWSGASISTRNPIYSVICADGEAYLTNKDYYYSN